MYCCGLMASWLQKQKVCQVGLAHCTSRECILTNLESSVVRGARLSLLRRTHGASTWVRHNHFDEARTSCDSQICSSSKLRSDRRRTKVNTAPLSSLFSVSHRRSIAQYFFIFYFFLTSFFFFCLLLLFIFLFYLLFSVFFVIICMMIG